MNTNRRHLISGVGTALMLTVAGCMSDSEDDDEEPDVQDERVPQPTTVVENEYIELYADEDSVFGEFIGFDLYEAFILKGTVDGMEIEEVFYEDDSAMVFSRELLNDDGEFTVEFYGKRDSENEHLDTLVLTEDDFTTELR